MILYSILQKKNTKTTDILNSRFRRLSHTCFNFFSIKHEKRDVKSAYEKQLVSSFARYEERHYYDLRICGSKPDTEPVLDFSDMRDKCYNWFGLVWFGLVYYCSKPVLWSTHACPNDSPSLLLIVGCFAYYNYASLMIFFG